MRTFIFTYDRPDSFTTPDFVWDENTTVLLHDEPTKAKYESANPKIVGQVIATGNPKGLAYQRNYALDQMETGEWAIFLVDDMKSLTRVQWLYDEKIKKIDVSLENQKKIKPYMKKPMPSDEFITYCQQLTNKVGDYNCNLIGFGNYDNVLFRGSRYSYNSLADGRAWLVRKTQLRFDEQTQLVDDMCWCAKNRSVGFDLLIANWILPDCRRYSKGAYGSKDERMEQKIRECKYIVDHYSDFVQYAPKAGWPELSHVKMRTAAPRDKRLKGI